MSSDLTRGEAPRLKPSKDGRWLAFSAPIDGAYELWRIAVADGRLERLTDGRHYISSWDAGPARSCACRRTCARHRPSRPTCGCSSWVDKSPSKPRRLTSFNAEVLDELELREPVDRHVTVDGRDIQGWLMPGGDGPRPLVVQIHGGPHTLYGWSPSWEFQILAGSRDRRLLLQPARLGGLRRSVQRRQPPRLGTGSDARRPGRRRRARGRRPGRPGATRRHRRVVRRLPHELDRRP